MNTMTVDHIEDDAFTIDIPHHRITVDQPTSDGGTDSGPTPTELFVARLAGCVAFYARRYLARHGLPERGLRVHAEYAMASRPPRVAQIRVGGFDLPEGVPDERRNGLLAVASRCTVHNSLVISPDVSIEFTGTSASLPARYGSLGLFLWLGAEG